MNCFPEKNETYKTIPKYYNERSGGCWLIHESLTEEEYYKKFKVGECINDEFVYYFLNRLKNEVKFSNIAYHRKYIYFSFMTLCKYIFVESFIDKYVQYRIKYITDSTIGNLLIKRTNEINKITYKTRCLININNLSHKILSLKSDVQRDKNIINYINKFEVYNPYTSFRVCEDKKYKLKLKELYSINEAKNMKHKENEKKEKQKVYSKYKKSLKETKKLALDLCYDEVIRLYKLHKELYGIE